MDVVAPTSGKLFSETNDKLGGHPPYLRHGPRPPGRRRRGQGGGVYGRRPLHETLNGYQGPAQQESTESSEQRNACEGSQGERKE
jgi:hypothetical protein